MRKVRVGIPSALMLLALAAGLAIGRVWLPEILDWIMQAAEAKPGAPRLTWPYDVVAGFVLMGFILPALWGHGARKRRAEVWKAAELSKWGFHSRDRGAAMINYVYYPVANYTDIAKGKRFYSEWLIIHDGWIIVNPGESIVYHDAKMVAYDFGARKTYAWDGCTPKWLFWWFALLGTPDWGYGARTVMEVDTAGRITDRTVPWQLAHHASLVHDAMCQYIDHIPLKRNEVNMLFRKMLLGAGMWWPVAWLYYIGVWVGSARRDRRVKKVKTGTWKPLMTIEFPDRLSGQG